MRTMIEGYRNHPGEHCGSVAMRGLLEHYCGLELPESVVFGLGAGLGVLYVRSGIDPSPVVFGRTASMEVDLADALGVDYREGSEPDDDLAWEQVREEVLAGRPTMLTGDIFYLDYRDYTVHFPSHRFVLLGFDDETERAFIADRIRPEAEACSYGALRESRNPPEGLSTYNLWGRFHAAELGRSLEEATRRAIARCAGAMLAGAGAGEVPGGLGVASAGVAGIRALAEDLPSWRGLDDVRRVASFNARCLEKFGNGGGNFRRLYAGFLAWAHDRDAKLVHAGADDEATRAADGWTALSETLGEVSQEGSDLALLDRAAARAHEIAELEETLFRRLADAAGDAAA